MGISVVTPHQSAVSVGNSHVGSIVSAVSIRTIYNPSVLRELICFGSVAHRPHPLAERSSLASFSKGEEMTFGSFPFHFNAVGFILLTDPITSGQMESISSSTVTKSKTTSSISSCTELDSMSNLYTMSALTSTPAMVYCFNCEAHHATSPDDCMKGYRNCLETAAIAKASSRRLQCAIVISIEIPVATTTKVSAKTPPCGNVNGKKGSSI
jgi:hypothetical protein